MDGDGVSSLSCIWKGDASDNSMHFQNVTKAKVSSLRSFHPEKALALDYLCHDNEDARDEWRAFLEKVDAAKGTTYLKDTLAASTEKKISALADLEW